MASDAPRPFSVMKIDFAPQIDFELSDEFGGRRRGAARDSTFDTGTGEIQGLTSR
jgi:hypothetical protein